MDPFALVRCQLATALKERFPASCSVALDYLLGTDAGWRAVQQQLHELRARWMGRRAAAAGAAALALAPAAPASDGEAPRADEQTLDVTSDSYLGADNMEAHGTELLVRAVTSELMSRGLLRHLVLSTSGLTVPEGKATVVQLDQTEGSLRVRLSWNACEATVNNKTLTRRIQRMTLSSDTLSVDEMNQFIHACVPRFMKSICKRYPPGRRYFRLTATRSSTHHRYDERHDMSLFFTDAGEISSTPGVDWDGIYIAAADKEVLRQNWQRAHGARGKCGFLFWGAPGTGKTYALNRLIAASNRHVILLPSDFASWDAGVLQRLFEAPKITISRENGGNETFDIAPLSCLFVVEEMEPIRWDLPGDAPSLRVGTKRRRERDNNDKETADDDSSESDRSSRVTAPLDGPSIRSGLLTLLDGIPAYETLAIIATTNISPSDFDPALMRPGRLRPIEFQPVTRETASSLGVPTSAVEGADPRTAISLATLFECAESSP